MKHLYRIGLGLFIAVPAVLVGLLGKYIGSWLLQYPSIALGLCITTLALCIYFLGAIVLREVGDE